MRSDILPTGFECGVLNGQSEARGHGGRCGRGAYRAGRFPDIAIQFTASIFMIDLDDKRRGVRKAVWCDQCDQQRRCHAADQVMELTQGAGVDVATSF
jgi:alcohol dehydrogenase